MLQISLPHELQTYALQQRREKRTIGFVPTMGALHEGHLSLFRTAQSSCDVVIASIFVNPTQFNNPEDFKKYPNTLSADLELLKKEKVEAVFLPTAEVMYSDNKRFSVHESTHHLDLCGKTRPGHFDGVLTVVLKLVQITQPTKIFMGEKDYQQLQLVREMVSAFFIPTEVIGCPTVRDPYGLALSSRNARLTQEGLLKARLFAETLKAPLTLEALAQTLEKNNIKIDYLEDKSKRRFAAVFIDDVRLIDNVPL